MIYETHNHISTLTFKSPCRSCERHGLFFNMINIGSAKKYCCEVISQIDNYEQAVNDKAQTWNIHHILEVQGQFYNSVSLLKRCGIYYNVPASQLIFLTHSDHMRIHKIGNNFGRKGKPGTRLGAKLSEQTKNKIRTSKIGKPSNRKGVHLTESTKTKISEARIGRRWYNNGLQELQAYECPIGFMKGRL